MSKFPTTFDQLSLFPGSTSASSGDSPVKESQHPEQVEAWRTNAANSGLKCSESSEELDRIGSSLKTSLLSALGEPMSSLVDWKQKATPAGRSWWVLSMPGRPIEDKESLSSPLWPTPLAHNSKGAAGANFNKTGDLVRAVSSLWPTPTTAEAGKIANRPNYGQVGLSNHPERVGLPNRDKARKGDGKAGRVAPEGSELAQKKTLRPTATAGDAKSSGAAGYSTKSGRHSGTTLTDATVGPRVQVSSSTPGSRPVLNPHWVECLMGFPSGWSLVSEESASRLWETLWCPKSRKRSGEQ